MAEEVSTSVGVSSIQTSAFETAVAGVYQTATANIPTITPFPTTTPVPNTPTSSPVPTLTTEPTVTPDVYEISISQKVPAYADAFLEVLANNQEVADDTSLLFDTSWKIKQGLALGTLELRANEMAALQPSPKYVTLHSIIIELATETQLFTTAYAKGIDHLDSYLIDQAIQHMQRMNVLMDQASAELKRIEANP